MSKLKLLQRSRKKSVVLDRRAPGGIKAIQEKLKRQLVGWAMYYGNAIPKGWQAEIDQWIRRRIRQLLWKQWKTPHNRQKQFAQRWSKAPTMGEYAYSVNSYWRMARTPVINKALDNLTLYHEGWMTLEYSLTTGQKLIHKIR
ncbi:MAG: group II intron maturase-specific domain-containing protein [Anaerobiospirillum sp.]|nr:group II intron maturase-specific domain-containing protein [Anaerobiospirillum sp.]